MLFINKKKFLTKYEEDIYMANKILKKLGTIVEEYHYFSLSSKTHYFDRCYYGYGLKIFKTKNKDSNNKEIYIFFNGNKVLGNNVYEEGLWEEILKEIYNKIPILVEIKERQDTLFTKKQNLLYNIDRIAFKNDKIKVNSNVEIKAFNISSGSNKEHYGRLYTVYENKKEVFVAYLSSTYGNGYYKYVPGNWEKDIESYLNYIIDQNKHLNEKEFALDSIKRLKKLR